MTSDDRGAATLLALALVNLLLLLGMVGAVVGSLAITRARAATVADVAALAAAQSWGDPCADARAVADANGMSTISCRIEGTDAVVEIAAPTPDVVGRWFALLGREPTPVRVAARAGIP